MANLTITVDAETLKRARIRAIERGESVNQFLAAQLKAYADLDADAVQWHKDKVKWWAAIDKLAKPQRGEPYVWDRDEIYEERLSRYGVDR